MKIGLVGKPNVGKSTFFKAATLKDVAIADYPFTTIEPNVGVAHVRTPCPHVELGLAACHPQHGSCANGTRFVPVELVDVAGLVPGASQGKGLGNKFLDDLRRADALIHVVDASGSSDGDGQPLPPGTRDPLEDVRFLEEEIVAWIDGILSKDWEKVAKRVHASGESLDTLLHDKLAGLGLGPKQIAAALREGGDPHLIARAVRRIGKPFLVALNKADKVPKPRLQEVGTRLGKTAWHATAADAEIALRGAAKAGLVRYEPGAPDFEVVDPSKLSPKQAQALGFIRDHVLTPYGSTGVLAALEQAAYELLDLIVVYPVEDETHCTDKQGHVLPDAHLVPRGSTAKDLAYRVHTQLGDRFIRAIDARKRRAVGADHPLENGDVVRIVADA